MNGQNGQTILYTKIHFEGETFNYRWEVENKLRAVQEAYQQAKDTLRDLVFMTDPQKYFTDLEEGETIYSKVQELFDACMHTLKVTQWDIDNYETLLADWDKCHNENGVAIFPPKDHKYHYMFGDYIDGVYPDGTPVE